MGKVKSNRESYASIRLVHSLGRLMLMAWDKIIPVDRIIDININDQLIGPDHSAEPIIIDGYLPKFPDKVISDNMVTFRLKDKTFNDTVSFCDEQANLMRKFLLEERFVDGKPIEEVWNQDRCEE